MGKLLAIARKEKSRAPMEEIQSVRVDETTGVAGDLRGKTRDRQVTVVAREAWAAACAELDRELPWTTRRANLLVEDVVLPHRDGARIAVGAVLLEVAAETQPCQRMEEQAAGLLAALTPDWRGGVCCRVVTGGDIAVGDDVSIVAAG